MKSGDVLVAAWEDTLARKGDAPAIFDKRGEVLRTFRQIEEYALAVEEKFGAIKPGNIHVIQVRQS